MRGFKLTCIGRREATGPVDVIIDCMEAAAGPVRRIYFLAMAQQELPFLRDLRSAIASFTLKEFILSGHFDSKFDEGFPSEVPCFVLWLVEQVDGRKYFYLELEASLYSPRTRCGLEEVSELSMSEIVSMFKNSARVFPGT